MTDTPSPEKSGTDSAAITSGSPPSPLEPTRTWDADRPPEAGEEDFNESASSVSVRPKDRFGKYIVESVIGHGGMGVVLKARDPDLNRVVAIKILGTHLAYSPTARRRFLREARAVASISHPHVLTIHSVDEQENVPFIVMEYVPGKSLKEYVTQKKRLDSDEVIKLTTQIAQGLAAAHAQGIIHRDVKPGNVMLHDGATRVRLADFGLARITFDNSELTSIDQTVGTPSYMAPEQIRCEDVDARSDLFSLGCVVFYMLVGRSPFQGRTSTETMSKILEEPAPRLKDLNPEVPSVLSDIVDRLLKKKPEERYQSAFEVAEECSRYVTQLNMARTDESIKFEKPLVSAPSRNASQSRLILWLTACVAGLMAGTGVIGWISSMNPQPPPASTALGIAPLDPAADKESEGLPRLKIVTVGPGPEADVSSINEAVQRIAAGGTITLTGPHAYYESVRLDGPEFDGVTLQGSDGVTWSCPDGDGGSSLLLEHVSDITVEGIRFLAEFDKSRVSKIAGATGNIRFRDCRFEGSDAAQSLSLVLVEADGKSDQATAIFENCQFVSPGGHNSKCLAVDSDSAASARVVCRGCRFEAKATHVYVTEQCRQLEVSHCIFIGGNNGINFSYKPWHPDTKLNVSNNTFVEVRYWLGLMDSFRDGTTVPHDTAARICNNLILGGERLQGGEDQWSSADKCWSFGNNWWEPSPETKHDAGRGGRVAVMKPAIELLNRTDAGSPDYLRPASTSPLLTSGAGGDLPHYIGAVGR